MHRDFGSPKGAKKNNDRKQSAFHRVSIAGLMMVKEGIQDLVDPNNEENMDFGDGGEKKGDDEDFDDSSSSSSLSEEDEDGNKSEDASDGREDDAPDEKLFKKDKVGLEEKPVTLDSDSAFKRSPPDYVGEMAD